MAILVRDKTKVRSVETTSAQLVTGTLGEEGEAGQSVRLSSSDNKYYLSDANTIDPILSEFDGTLLNGGAENEKVAIQIGGTFYPGVDAVEGMLYCVSATAGEIEEATSSLVTGNNTTLIGYGDENGNIVISKLETGLTIPS